MKTQFFRAGVPEASNRRWTPFLKGACVLSVLSVLGGAGLAGHWLVARSASDAEKPRSAEAERLSRSGDGPSAAVLSNTASGERWKIGARRVYGVDSSMQISSEPADPNGAVDLTGEGALALTVVSQDAGSVVLRGELLDFVGTYSSSAGESRGPEEALAKPFLVQLTPRGSIESVSIHPELVGVWHALLRTIVATSQFVMRGERDPDARSWHAEESDQLGRYRARYEAMGPGVFSKTKGVYSHFELAPDLLRSGRDPQMSSKTELTVDSSGLVRRAEAVESTHVELGATTLVSTTQTTLVLKSESPGDRGSHEAWMSAESPLYANRAAGLTPETELERKQKLVEGASLDTLAQALRDATPGSDARWDTMERMSALFDLDPASIKEARRLLAGRMTPEDARGIMGALAGSTAPEAQKVLTDVAKDAAQEGATRNTALVHLALASTPTEGTLTELASLVEGGEGEVRDRAVLALGGAAGQALQQPETQAKAAEAVGTLERAVQSSTDERSRELFMTALGNAGSPSSFELLKQQLGDANPSIRSAALQAMRFIPGAEVDGILAQCMLKDPSLIVRQAAVIAAGHRDLSATVAQAATQLLRSGEDESLRFEVLRAIGPKLMLAGQRDLIEFIAANDPSSILKNKANNLLGRDDA